MGRYQDIVNLIEQSVPEYTSLKIVPRGTPIFSDPLMTGEIRFARKTGANFAVLNPDNQFKLSTDAQVEQTVLNVDRVLPWFEIGSLVTFNKTEMLEVGNWDPENNAVFVNSPLSAPRAAGSEVALWATPLIVHFDSIQGTKQLFVRSRYQLANGDAVTFPLAESLNSLKQIDVVKASYAGQDLDPEYPYIYVLELAEQLPITLQATFSRCYLRAFPAYVSRVLRVPRLSSGQIGPFLVDFTASPLDAITGYDETFSIRTFTSADQVVEGSLNEYKTVPRNYPIIHRPIFSENMIFWNMIRGYGGYILPNRFRMVTDSQLPNGEWAARVSTEFVPPLPPGLRYEFRVRANTEGEFIAIPEPYATVITSVPVTTDTTIVIDTTNETEPLTKLDFIFRTARQDTEITITDMNTPTNPVVERLQYAYVFRVVGATNFQATSLICKPYFLSLADLKARYDDGKTYNSGFIYL